MMMMIFSVVHFHVSPCHPCSFYTAESISKLFIIRICLSFLYSGQSIATFPSTTSDHVAVPVTLNKMSFLMEFGQNTSLILCRVLVWKRMFIINQNLRKKYCLFCGANVLTLSAVSRTKYPYIFCSVTKKSSKYLSLARIKMLSYWLLQRFGLKNWRMHCVRKK